MSARGFSLIELLVASTLVVVIGGVVFAILTPARAILRRSFVSADLDAGVRAALHQIAAELREAGSDAAVAPVAWRLASVLPAVALVESLDSPAAAQPAGAIAIRRTPPLAAQGRLDVDAAAGDSLLRLDLASRCSSGPPSCGFSAGQRVVLFNQSSARVATIEATGGGVVVLSTPLGAPFPAGAILCVLETTMYGLRRTPDGAARLVRVTEGGTEQPVLDNVVAFEVSADSGDATQIGLISIRIRVQAPSVEFRGPAGYLFAQAGTSREATRWVPDVELRTEVALRNVGGRR
jgi:hypothetical protein